MTVGTSENASVTNVAGNQNTMFIGANHCFSCCGSLFILLTVTVYIPTLSSPMLVIRSEVRKPDVSKGLEKPSSEIFWTGMMMPMLCPCAG